MTNYAIILAQLGRLGKEIPVVKIHKFRKIGDLVQLARTLDLHSRGRGFESHFLHQKLYAGVAERMGSTTIRRTYTSMVV